MPDFMVLLRVFRPSEPRFPRLHGRLGSKTRRPGYKFPAAFRRAQPLGGEAKTARSEAWNRPPARSASSPAPDGRQSETALKIARGTARLLRSLGFSCIAELPLPSGRRADLVALNERGDIWIVEIKSSLEDLRADHKWPEYRAHCDRLFFAFTQDLPCEIFPADTGLIVADAYGAHMHCEAPEHRLPAPTRKSMTVRFAIAAAQRINRLVDPQGHGEF